MTESGIAYNLSGFATKNIRRSNTAPSSLCLRGKNFICVYLCPSVVKNSLRLSAFARNLFWHTPYYIIIHRAYIVGV